MVDRTRILAIRADPPEINPGESAVFEALIPQPGIEEPWPRLWFACPPASPGGIGFGCNLDLATTTATDGTGTAMPDGLIGFEPGLPPYYESDPYLLDGIEDERDLAEGLHVLVQVTAAPPELLEGATADLDFNEIELGYKRLVISGATTPNRNPRIAEFTVDLQTVPLLSLVHVTAKQTYEPGVFIDIDTVETYEYLNRDGVVETRTEEPYVSWYTTGGTIVEAVTLYPFTETTWKAPEESGSTGTWYAVVRDRRGGMGWYSQKWIVD
jgi:hypothetical protein